jgi:hypothetical protein
MDIAMDISNMTVKQISHTVPSFSGRKNDIYGLDHGTGEMDTYYVGKRHGNPRHFVRIYDKINEAQSKKKMVFYADYLEYSHVTRIELQINILSCTSFGIDVEHSHNNTALSTIVRRVLQNRSTQWSIMPFIEEQLAKYDEQDYAMVSFLRDVEPMSRTAYFQRFFAMAENVYKDWGVDPVHAVAWYMKANHNLRYQFDLSPTQEQYAQMMHQNLKKTDEEFDLPF